MSNKFLSIIVLISMLLLGGCQTNDGDIPLIHDNNKGVNVPMDSVKGLSPDEAISLCYEKLGETDGEGGYDRGNNTGNKIGYRCVGAVKFKDKNYYILYTSWLVSNNHWSYIGYTLVSADADEIYDGAIDSDGNKKKKKKIWEKT